MMEASNLKELLPNWYEHVYEFSLLMETEQDLVEELLQNIRKTQDNLYISKADSDTLRVYERMLKLTIRSDDTLESRRFRILARLTSQKPYTKRYLQEMVQSFGSPAVFDIKYNQYLIDGLVTFEQKGQMEELDYLLRVTIPANMVFNVKNEMNLSSSSKIFFATAFTCNEEVMITHDIKESNIIQQIAYLANGPTITAIEMITQDIKETNSIFSEQQVNNAYTTNEVVEIK